MSRLLASLILGTVAGIIDVIPMVALGTSHAAMVSAFLHWVVLGFIISYLRLDVASWLKGVIVGLASAIPVVTTLAEAEPKSVPPVVIMSALLGAGVGWMAGRVSVLRGLPAARPPAARPE